MALVCALPPTRDTEMPTLMAGRTPEKKRSLSRKIWPSVIEMTFVGNVGRDVARLGLDDRKRRQGARAQLVVQLGGALERREWR
jgi:hypothetical protein